MYNCFTAELWLGSDTNWVGSDGTAKNGEGTVGAAFTWNILGPSLLWKTSASLIEGVYWEYPGGRNDLNYWAKSLLQWKPSDNVSLAASVEYYEQLSSQESVDFHKYVLFPRVVATASF
jgi:hypothetical protein